MKTKLVGLILKICLALLVFAFYYPLKGQGSGDFKTLPVSINAYDKSLKEILSIVEQQIPYKFAYNTELIAKHKNISVSFESKTLNELLNQLLKGTNLTYSIIDNQIILSELPLPQKITISGYIKDSISGETLPGAIVYFPERSTGTYTNNYGYFSVTQTKADSLNIIVSYAGFNKINRKVSGLSNSAVNFYLTSNNLELNSILVTDSRADDNIKKTYPGKTDISMERVRAMPSVGGTGDIISTIQMMPGVMAGLDGRPGYFIRGGNTDQNLVQLDEATLYNPNHLLGLVGIFNSSAIKRAYLLKAGFPASFGDHLSSVLDVTMKDGNNQQFNGDVQLGTISGGFTLSGPIVSDKASFFVAARRSTIDLLLKPFEISNYYSNYNFYDVNAKLNFKISTKDHLFVSYYQGNDYSSYSRDTATKSNIDYNVSYGNKAVTFRWNHVFSPKVFSNTSVTYNNYFHQVKARQDQYFAELYSGIRDMEVKTDLSFYPNENHKISAGVNYLHQTLFPASVTGKSGDAETDYIDPSEIPQTFSNRVAAYFSDEVTLGRRFSAYLGARLPYYQNSSVHYLQFEPRLSLMYLLNQSTSVKISYTHMHQYLHLVQSFNASFPAQVWIGSSKLVKPQNCEETSLGLFKNFHENMFQTSLEVYYKKMGNQLLFRGGLNPDISSNMENTLIFGEGQSYGTEFYFAKTTGKLTGWLAYTLSYSNQKFDSLNMGKQFPFANDRRHNIYLSTSYAINKHWEVSSNFIYSSGSAFSLFKNIPPNKWQYDNPLFYYSGGSSSSGPTVSATQIVQNNFRLAPYNRLDLSVTYRKTKNLPNRVLETEWVFSVYNVYGRENTFFAYCSIDPVTKKPIAVQVSFIPVIPSISYYLKF